MLVVRHLTLDQLDYKSNLKENEKKCVVVRSYKYKR